MTMTTQPVMSTTVSPPVPNLKFALEAADIAVVVVYFVFVLGVGLWVRHQKKDLAFLLA